MADLAPLGIAGRWTGGPARWSGSVTLKACARLVGESAVVTVSGPGGAGKTRLVLELASRLLRRFPDGIWLADLAPIRAADPFNHYAVSFMVSAGASARSQTLACGW